MKDKPFPKDITIHPHEHLLKMMSERQWFLVGKECLEPCTCGCNEGTEMRIKDMSCNEESRVAWYACGHVVMQQGDKIATVSVPF